jgi:FkbM family methyltransferase
MNYRKRLPTIQSSLRALADSGLKIDIVVDVGVLTGTGYLIDAFPDAFHHLFEPLDSHDTKISENYRAIRYELNHVALSSESGVAYIVGICRDASGVTTHSFVTNVEVSTSSEFAGAPVTECRRVTKATLDEHFSVQGAPEGAYLVKIDVDGHELSIISGGQKTISGAEIVIVEATMRTLVERGAAIRALGFQLIDIVDLYYYYDTLSQVDLIFANDRLLDRFPALRPWGVKKFTSEAWFGLSSMLKAKLISPSKP